MAQRIFVKSSKFSVCLVMTLLGQQTQIYRNKAGVFNMVLTNIFATFYMTNGLHKPFFVSANCNLSHKNWLIFLLYMNTIIKINLSISNIQMEGTCRCQITAKQMSVWAKCR